MIKKRYVPRSWVCPGCDHNNVGDPRFCTKCRRVPESDCRIGYGLLLYEGELYVHYDVVADLPGNLQWGIQLSYRFLDDEDLPYFKLEDVLPHIPDAIGLLRVDDLKEIMHG